LLVSAGAAYALAACAYVLFGHRIIQAAYAGVSLAVLNRVISGQATNPVTVYLHDADRYFFVCTLYFLCVFSFCLAFLISTRGVRVWAVVREGLHVRTVPWQWIRRRLLSCAADKRAVVFCIFLFVIFWSLYAHLGLSLGAGRAFGVTNLLFGADPPAIINVMTHGQPCRSIIKHPIYALLVAGPGWFLQGYTHSDCASAVFLNSFWGAINVCLVFILFRLMTKNDLRSSLVALIFGLTMSQVFFGSVPEVFVMALTSLLVMYLLFFVSLESKRLSLWPWLICGIGTAGITSTNFVQTVVCFAIVAHLTRSQRKNAVSALSLTLVYTGLVACAILVLIAAQKLLYPNSDTLFFRPDRILEEFRFVIGIRDIVPGFIQALKNFLLVGFIAPLPEVFRAGALTHVTFSNSWNYTTLGWLAAGLWCFMLVYSVREVLFRQKAYPLFFTAVIISFFFNVCLHSLYGRECYLYRILPTRIELFMYTPHVIFLALLFLGGYKVARPHVTNAGLATLAIIAGVNNLLVMGYLVGLYS
jgi:hypothetical protein